MDTITQKLVAAATWRPAKICGHKTPREGEIEVFGERVRLRMIVDAHKKPYFCLQCYAAAVTRCAWCTRLILPGDSVTLLTPCQGFEVPKHAVVYSRTPLKLVGCMHPDCVDQNGHECGTWQISMSSGHGHVTNLQYGERAFSYAVESSRHYLPPKKPYEMKSRR